MNIHNIQTQKQYCGHHPIYTSFYLPKIETRIENSHNGANSKLSILAIRVIRVIRVICTRPIENAIYNIYAGMICLKKAENAFLHVKGWNGFVLFVKLVLHTNVYYSGGDIQSCQS